MSDYDNKNLTFIEQYSPLLLLFLNHSSRSDRGYAVVVLGHVQGIGGSAGFDGGARKNRWNTVFCGVFLVSLGCKRQAKEKGNEGQDLGFHQIKPKRSFSFFNFSSLLASIFS